MNANYLKMAGVTTATVQPTCKAEPASIDSLVRGLLIILCAVVLFVLGALGGSELERRRAVAEGAAERTASGVTYIDGKSYRAVCMRDLKTWQDFQRISTEQQAAELHANK